MKLAAHTSLHARLTAQFIAVMLGGLLIFAAIAVFTIDRTLHSTLDARLSTVANAAASFIDVSHDRIVVDADDREQFLQLTGADTQGVIADARGRILLSSTARPPQAIRNAHAQRPAFFDAGRGEVRLRAFMMPIERGGSRIGSVVVWRGSDWIDETDRGAAIAFAVGALAIAGLSLLAGSAVTRRALADAFARQRRFTADASHELRAPLAVIRAEADLALRKERETSEYRAALETIASEADSMEALIGDLLSAARAEGGVAARDYVSLDDVARRVRDRLAPAAAAKHVEILLRSQPDAEIMADSQALERALTAVVHNAVKYASARIEIAIRSGEMHEIVVEDDGPGFSAEALRHALGRFWRDEGSRSGGGSGLGLAIAQSIVESSGGDIALGNTSRGAQVRLRFPATRRSDYSNVRNAY